MRESDRQAHTHGGGNTCPHGELIVGLSSLRRGHSKCPQHQRAAQGTIYPTSKHHLSASLTTVRGAPNGGCRRRRDSTHGNRWRGTVQPKSLCNHGAVQTTKLAVCKVALLALTLFTCGLGPTWQAALVGTPG